MGIFEDTDAGLMQYARENPSDFGATLGDDKMAMLFDLVGFVDSLSTDIRRTYESELEGDDKLNYDCAIQIHGNPLPAQSESENKYEGIPDDLLPFARQNSDNR